MDNRPRISVVMAVYNGKSYLPEQLDSILRQLRDTDELLVLDDGSEDGSRELLRAYAQKWKQIRLYLNDKRMGPVQNFGQGLAMAAGDVIFLSDQDDIWQPEKAETVCRAMKAGAKPQLVLHNAQFMDAQGKKLNKTLFQWRGVRIGFWKNWLKNSYMGCCMALNRPMAQKVLPIPNQIPMHDQWIGLLAEHYGTVTLLDQCLIGYRRHGGNATQEGHSSVMRMMAWRLQILIQFAKRVIQGGCK